MLPWLDIIKTISSGLATILAMRCGWIAILLWQEHRQSLSKEAKLGPAAAAFFASILELALWSIIVPLIIEMPLWARVWQLTIIFRCAIFLELFFIESHVNRER